MVGFGVAIAGSVTRCPRPAKPVKPATGSRAAPVLAFGGVAARPPTRTPYA